MSDTGSSLGGIIDAKALRLDDPTPPPESAMASPSLRTAAGSAPTQNAPSVAEQNGSIKELMKQPLQAGDTWYLVSTVWFKKWAELCDSASEAPSSEAQGLHNVGPIDNSGLLAVGSDPSVGQPSLAPDCREGVHFELVPAEAWNLLSSWYGVSGPLFPRHCVLGPDGHNVTLELYVPMISFTRLVSPATGQKALDIPMAIISRVTPLLEVRQRAMVELQLKVESEADVRLWTLPDNVASVPELDAREAQAAEGYEVVEETLLSEQLAALLTRPPGQIQPFGVEVKGSDGIWPSDRVEAQAPAKANVRNIFAQTGGDSFSRLQQSAPVAIPEPQTTMTAPRAMTTRSKTASERSTGVVLGLKGLSNMGNTCFMNSALQCLSNTPELRDYFVSKVFEEEINVDNPLGNKGALAEAFGHLIQQLWSGFGTSFQPRDFKWSLARFAPQFSGYAQQDTQELLAFLLDGLHEDLNRIKKKPYIEAPDWQGGGLKEMVKFAKKQWEIYKARNDSVIVDLFQGQYRSTLVCPECSKVSIKFDPFMYLTLPLPSKAKWRHQVTFIPYDPQSPIKTVSIISYERQVYSSLTNKHMCLGLATDQHDLVL
jgi:ubiquitin carboxyl-terminal hydrolase 4/11/15